MKLLFNLVVNKILKFLRKKNKDLNAYAITE